MSSHRGPSRSYPGADVVDNTLAEQEYYYEDGCLYIASMRGYGILNVSALYPQLLESFNKESESKPEEQT